MEGEYFDREAVVVFAGYVYKHTICTATFDKFRHIKWISHARHSCSIFSPSDL